MKTNFIAFALMGCAISVGSNCQTTHPHSTKPKQIEGWDEKKLAVTAQRPYISERGFLVLPYTVTNNENTDILLDFKKSSYQVREPDRAYFLRKDTNSFQQIDIDHDDVLISPSLLPSGLPVHMTVVIGTGKYSDSKLFESDSDKLSRAISEQVGNVSAIVVFVPLIHAKLTLPVKASR